MQVQQFTVKQLRQFEAATGRKVKVCHYDGTKYLARVNVGDLAAASSLADRDSAVWILVDLRRGPLSKQLSQRLSALSVECEKMALVVDDIRLENEDG